MPCCKAQVPARWHGSKSYCDKPATKDGYCREHHPKRQLKKVVLRIKMTEGLMRHLARERDLLIEELEELEEVKG